MASTDPLRTAPIAAVEGIPNGAAFAAYLAAAIGVFAMGLISLLAAIGVISIPALYRPAGGVSGRTTLAVVIWLIAWAILHQQWKGRELASGPRKTIIVLVLLGILFALPPVWTILE